MPRIRLPVADSCRAERPLGFEELLQRENLPPRGEIPQEFLTRFSDRRVFVSGDEAPLPVQDCGHGLAMFRLPPNAYLGRRGQTMEVQDGDRFREERGPLDAYRPEWAGYLDHPKISTVPQQPDLRRANGQRMVPEHVFDPDGRSFFYPAHYPMHCIGRLEIYDEWGSPWRRTGTATLVGSKTIVTAAHCMPPIGRGAWGVRFVPAYSQGFSAVGMDSWCEEYRVATTSVSDATEAFDVAVAKLYDPLGDALGWFGARSYNDDWEDEELWTLVGYPDSALGLKSDGQWPTLQHGVRVVDDDPDGAFAEIEHMGDTSDGNSGGPLFGTWPEGPYVIGVHSGYEHRTIDLRIAEIVAENNNVAGGGRGMVEMIRQARVDWP